LAEGRQEKDTGWTGQRHAGEMFQPIRAVGIIFNEYDGGAGRINGNRGLTGHGQSPAAGGI